jgi:hypothetical protein
VSAGLTEQPPAMSCGWCGGEIAPDAPRVTTECCGPMHVDPHPDGPLEGNCHGAHAEAKHWEETNGA